MEQALSVWSFVLMRERDSTHGGARGGREEPSETLASAGGTDTVFLGGHRGPFERSCAIKSGPKKLN